MAKPIRHGDILIIPVQVSGKLTRVERDTQKGVVLAYGESTGHAHHLLALDAVLYEPAIPGQCEFRFDGIPLKIDTVGGGTPRVLEVPTATSLFHHDHGLGIPDGRTELSTPIEPGKYVVIRQRERSFSDIAGYIRVMD